MVIYDDLLASNAGPDRIRILRHKADVYNNTGFINMIQSDMKEGLENFSRALKIYQEIGDKKKTANPILNTGRIYLQQGNYPEALKQYLAALKIYEETGNKSGCAGAYGAIGSIYIDQGNNADALKYLLASLKLQRELGSKINIGITLTNIGNVYLDLGNYPEALKYQNEALKIAVEVGNKAVMANCYNELGGIYYSMEKYDEALKNHTAGLTLSQEVGDKSLVVNCFIGIGNDYLQQKKYSESSLYLHKGLALGKEIGEKNYIKESYSALADLDSATGNYKQALENYKLFITYKDSLVNEEKTKKLVQMQMQYDFDKKESLVKAEQEKKDILAHKELQQQKLLRNIFIGIIILLLVFSFLIYRGYRARQLLRLNDIRNRIAGDLHDDIGSTLNSISIYAEVARKNDEHHDEALEMIGDASRKIIDAMSDIVWTINPENDSFEKIIFRMKSLAYNLFRAKNIEFTFHVDEILNEKKMSLEERRNFFLIFKETINNLVKYSEASRVSIALTYEDNAVRLRIRDNGAGFDTTLVQTGNGLKNMKRRAGEMKAEFIIESQTGSGTQTDLILKA